MTTTLRSIKYVFMRPSGTFEQPKWVGPGSMLGSLNEPLGELVVSKASAVRTHHRLGKFRLASSAVRAPGVTSAALTVKQRVGAKLASLGEVYQDIDILTKLSCHTVDDFNDWEVIKRLSKCIILSSDVDGETSYTPEANGEPVVSLPVASTERTTLIKHVVPVVWDLYAKYPSLFGQGYDTEYPLPIVAANRITNEYVFSAINSDLQYAVAVGSVTNLNVMGGMLGSSVRAMDVVDNIIIVSSYIVSYTNIISRPEDFEDVVYAWENQQLWDGEDHMLVGRPATDVYYDGGIRFRDVQIPVGVVISHARVGLIREHEDHPLGEDGIIVIIDVEGEDADDPNAFSTEGNFYARPLTTANVIYTIPFHLEVGTMEHTPNISAIIREIVGRVGWASGNSLVVFMFAAIGTVDENVRYTRSIANWYADRARLYVTYGVITSTVGAFVSHDCGDSFTPATCETGQCEDIGGVRSYSGVTYIDSNGLHMSRDGGLNAVAYGSLSSTGSYITDEYNGLIYLADSDTGRLYITDTLTSRFYMHGSSLLPTILAMAGGMLAGLAASSTMVVLGSEDNVTWSELFSLGVAVDDTDYVMLLVYATHGVYYLCCYYSPDAGTTLYFDIYRSVYYGIVGTWDLLYQETALSASQTILRPYSMACVDENSCIVAGNQRQTDGSLTGYYAIEISPEGEVN